MFGRYTYELFAPLWSRGSELVNLTKSPQGLLVEWLLRSARTRLQIRRGVCLSYDRVHLWRA